MVKALPREEFEKRLERTQELLHQRELDGLIAFSSYAEREGHVCYLTNHHNSFPNVLSHVGLGHAALVLPGKGKGVLVSPMGYEAEKVIGIDYAKTGCNLIADIVSAVREKRLDDRKIGIVGLDVIPTEYYNGLVEALPEVTFVDANDLLESQRIIKSRAEVELLREAARIADVGLQAGMGAVREGITQYEIGLAARGAALDAGADFIPRVRVSSGKKISTLSWPMATEKKVEKGDFVYLDFIGWFGNYGFDNSRVTVVGEPSEKQRDYLGHLVEATEWMIGVLKPGLEIEFVYTESRGRAIRPFGHGIGLEICENPWVTIGRRLTLQPNMVICVEPMVISPEFGSMSIEDTVVVTETKAELLTQCPRVFW